MICVSVAHMSGLKEALESGANLLELRLDLIGERPSALFPLIPPTMDTIITCRPGGFGDKERVKLLQEGMRLGASYVDIELETAAGDLDLLLNTARQENSKVIISYHNFKKTVDREELESVMIACYEKGGEIAKIATQVNAPEDIRNLISLYDLPGKKVILGMGSKGRITRVMGPYLGAEFTFASTGKGGKTAPGQLSVKQLSKLFKVIDKA